MVVIYTRQTDDTTIDIIQWLQSLGKKTFRINIHSDLEYVQDLIAQNKVDSFYFNGRGLIFENKGIEDAIINMQVDDYLNEDIEVIFSYLLNNLSSNIRIFGLLPYPKHKINKLEVLKFAQKSGLNIPKFEIIYNKSTLSKLKNRWNRIICKPLSNGININSNNLYIVGQKTEEILKEDIVKFPDNFFPTYVQQLIEKSFEIRVFYFNKSIYSIANFSQSNEKSKIDGRIIDIIRPQRRVPFQLSDEIESKIDKLMESLSLNYGSLDFIVDRNLKYYFLEVNPYGQYGFLSEAGNYYIEKEIAEYL